MNDNAFSFISLNVLDYFSISLASPGKALYLEDLYVNEKYRRFGIGTLMMTVMVKFALENKCARLKWEVLHWNEVAIRFYEKIQASVR